MFALSTGICSYFNIFRPILQTVERIENLDVSKIKEFNNPLKTAAAIILSSAILAPILFIPSLFGPSRDFVEEYVNTILPDDMP